MIQPLLLAFALLPQGAPTHAALHPAETDVYVEFVQVAGALQALDKAPLLRFLRDESLKGLLSKVGQSPDRPLAELLQSGLDTALPGSAASTWLPGLQTVSFSTVALGAGAEGQDPYAILAIADLATPEQATALRTAILATVEKHEPMTGALPGMEKLNPGKKEGEFWCAVAGSRFVLGSSRSKPEDYVSRAGGKAGLAGNEDFKKRLAALGQPSGAPMFWFALARPIQEIADALKLADNDKEREFLKDMPAELNPLASARVARLSFTGERFVTEWIAKESAPAATKPVDPAWLEPVPSGSMVFYSTAVDGAAVGKRIRALLEKDPKTAASLTAIEQKLGFGPERVLAHLGPGLTVYSAPPTGLGLPEARAWIDCDDAAAFAKDFEALVGALGETLPGFQAKTKPYKVKVKGSEEKLEVPVTTLMLPPDLVQIPMISLAPSFAPVGKKLVFGFGSMDVKNELKRVHSGEGEAIVAGTNPLTALGFQLPAETRSVLVMDWAKLLGGVIGTIKGFASMASPGDLPFDPQQLPKPELFSQYFKPTFHYSKSTPAGEYVRNEASFGPETWFGLFGSIALAVRQQQSLGHSAPAAAAPLQPDGNGK